MEKGIMGGLSADTHMEDPLFDNKSLEKPKPSNCNCNVMLLTATEISG